MLTKTFSTLLVMMIPFASCRHSPATTESNTGAMGSGEHNNAAEAPLSLTAISTTTEPSPSVIAEQSGKSNIPSTQQSCDVKNRTQGNPLLNSDFANPKSCSCSSVYIDCSGSGIDPGAVATCAPGYFWCSMSLLPSFCQVFGLTTGVKMDPVTGLTKPPLNGAPLVVAMAHCVVKHELQHACDGASMSTCNTEANAYRRQAMCLQDYLAQFCAGAKSNVADCAMINLAITEAQAGQNWHQCRCNGLSAAVCTTQCTRNYPSQAAFCAKMPVQYTY